MFLTGICVLAVCYPSHRNACKAMVIQRYGNFHSGENFHNHPAEAAPSIANLVKEKALESTFKPVLIFKTQIFIFHSFSIFYYLSNGQFCGPHFTSACFRYSATSNFNPTNTIHILTFSFFQVLWSELNNECCPALPKLQTACSRNFTQKIPRTSTFNYWRTAYRKDSFRQTFLWRKEGISSSPQSNNWQPLSRPSLYIDVSTETIPAAGNDQCFRSISWSHETSSTIVCPRVREEYKRLQKCNYLFTFYVS